jgi:hypothetical protein
MSKRQIRELLSRTLPYLKKAKQKLALFTVVLILALSPIDYDLVHLHVESAPIVPTTSVQWAASGNVSAVIADEDFWRNPVAPVAASNLWPHQHLFDAEEPAGSLFGKK